MHQAYNTNDRIKGKNRAGEISLLLKIAGAHHRQNCSSSPITENAVDQQKVCVALRRQPHVLMAGKRQRNGRSLARWLSEVRNFVGACLVRAGRLASANNVGTRAFVSRSSSLRSAAPVYRYVLRTLPYL